MLTCDVGTTPVQILGASNDRIGVYLLSAVANTVTVGTSLDIVATGGMRVTTGNTIRDFTIDRYGSIVTAPWYAVSTQAANVLTIVEVLLTPDAAASIPAVLSKIRSGQSYT